MFFLSPKVLYLLGAMSLSMALQLDRHGLWNLLGPSLFALGIMAVAWVRRTATLHNAQQLHNNTAQLSRQTEEERKTAALHLLEREANKIFD